MMHAWTVASSQVAVTASGRPFSPSQTTMHTSSRAAVLDLGEHREPELGALAAVTGPQTEDVAFAVDGDADRDVDGLVDHLPVADLDHDGVDEQHRVDPVQRPGRPVGHLGHDLVG